MSLVKRFGAVGGTMSIKTHLKGTFGFSGFLYLVFFFIEEIWHDVQKGSGYILRSISSQTLSVSPANNDMADLWPNLWCNNYKAIFFLDGKIFVFGIFLSPQNMHVSFVHYVVMYPHFFILLQSKPCKTLFGINNHFPNSLT